MSIDLDGTSAGAMSISTPLATVIGQQYLLQFDLAGNPDSGRSSRRWTFPSGTRLRVSLSTPLGSREPTWAG
jgi:hypothetical protein